MLDFGFYNMDCMEGMKEFPDNYFDLAIVDPPYGAGFTDGGGCKGWNRFGQWFDRYKYPSPTEECQTTGGDEVWKKIISWDVAPKQEYFKELFRISQNQIIWGAITSTFRRHDASLYGGS